MKKALATIVLLSFVCEIYAQTKPKMPAQTARPSKQTTINYLNQKLKENCIGRFGEVTEEYSRYDADLKMMVSNWKDYNAFIVDNYDIKEENGLPYLTITLRSENKRKTFRAGLEDYDRFSNIVSTIPIAKIKDIIIYNKPEKVEQTKTSRKTESAATGILLITTANNVVFDQQDLQKKDFIAFQQFPNNNPEESEKIKKAFENLKSYYKAEADPFAETTTSPAGSGSVGSGPANLGEAEWGKASEKMKAHYNKLEQQFGKVFAMQQLGQIFASGQFVENDKVVTFKPDIEEAMKWYNKSTVAAGGNQEQINEGYSLIGHMFINRSTKLDLSKALYWLDKIKPVQGSELAEQEAGILHVLVDQDYDKAINYFKESGKKHGSGLVCLGLMYLNGLGVEKDIAEATNYFNKALQFHDPGFGTLDSNAAYYCLGLVALKKQDSAGALKLFRKAPAMQHCVDCRYQLAYNFIKNKRYKDAMSIYMASEEESDNRFSILSAYIYASGGDGIKQDYILAISYLAMAHEWDMHYKDILSGYSHFELFNASNEEVTPGLNIDYKMAFLKNSQAAKNGDATAIANLAYLYSMGLGVDKNIGQALKYYKQLAAKGDSASMFQLSILFDQIDRDVAAEWYSKAENAQWKERLNRK